MAHDHRSARAAFAAALASGEPASCLADVAAEHFPDLRAFTEADDLILVAGETRRLLVRRAGPDLFVTGDVASASASTNMLDEGGEARHDLDGLIQEIAAFAAA